MYKTQFEQQLYILVELPTCILFTAAINNGRLMDEEEKAARGGGIMKEKENEFTLPGRTHEVISDAQMNTSNFISLPSFPDLSPLPPRTTPLLKTPCRRRILSGCNAKRETPETHCPPPLRPPPHPLPETRSERWSSRSRTCCSWLGASTPACYGCRSRCAVRAEERAAPQNPPAFLPPPPERSWVRWARRCRMNAGH